MIYCHHGRENISRVAVLADIGCVDVVLGLAGCIGAVVTAYAVTGDVDVVKISR